MQNNNNADQSFSDECDIMSICKCPTDESNTDVCKCIGSWNIIKTFTKNCQNIKWIIKTATKQWIQKKFSIPRFFAVIIDPGMLRNPNMFVYARDTILQSLNNTPLVLAGDALDKLSIQSNQNILQSQQKSDKQEQQQKQNDGDTNEAEKNDFVILTPNAMEFRRLLLNDILNKDIGKIRFVFFMNDLFDYQECWELSKRIKKIH